MFSVLSCRVLFLLYAIVLNGLFLYVIGDFHKFLHPGKA